MSDIQTIQRNIEPLRKEIVNHQLYAMISDITHIRTFMEYHVYAVWDFMSLLKSLQNNLTCTSVPWFPAGDAETRYLINEIVAGEESDIDSAGIRKSHFEMYLDAMKQCGADTSRTEHFISTLQRTNNLEKSFREAGVPEEARDFMQFTFDTISNKPHIRAAVFTFGREDLIPGMFHSMIKDLDQKFPDSITKFRYYLERHIEVDGDHHSTLALQMTANLCGSNEKLLSEAEAAVMIALKKRKELWDGVYKKIST